LYVIRLVYQNQQSRLEIQGLRIENLQSQFEALKNQVSPHFLFNSLNSLKTLIREEPATAQEYLNHLSLILRYTLNANEKKQVTLNDELEFITSYFYLLKLRYNQNLHFTKHIDEKYFKYKVPPLALQVLIENAIKHNEISRRKPLEIEVFTTEKKSIIVKNNVNEKFSAEPGTGIGLTNLNMQYRFLAGRDIEIRNKENCFIVELPLFEP
ncbi:MAG: histidine kinase, partial [Bacteroidales bacterium]